MRNLFTLIFCVAWVAIVPPARAQWICHVTQGMWLGQNEFWYTALSCTGNNCFASAIGGPSGFGPDMRLIFLHSVDGGVTWDVQNPDFPVGDWTRKSIITAIEPIDSLNIIAYGDSNVFFRTTDAGVAWHQDSMPTARPILDINFSDSMHGILAAADTVDTIFTTSDGGHQWDRMAAPSMVGGVAQCHDYGQGKYRLFSYYYGQIYTTTDNWKTVDSTGPIISNPADKNKYGFGRCSFGLGDTIIAYGNYLNYTDTPFPLIARTTDGGHDWTLVYDDTLGSYGSVRALSDINRDTIIAGISFGMTVVSSTDHGITWESNGLICMDTDFIGKDNYGIGFTTNGNLVGTYALGELQSSLVVGRYVASDVISNDFRTPTEQLFPNPATASVTLTGATAGRTVHLLDIFGREVLSGKVSASGTLTLDVSHLPRGIYAAMIEHDGQILPVGRIVLTGE